MPGQSAGLFFAVVNSGTPDRLLSVSAPGAARSVTLPGGSVNLATNRGVFLTGPAPQVILNDLTRPLSGSAYIHLVMTFQNAGSVTLLVPVVPRASYYATFLPPPARRRPPRGASTRPCPDAQRYRYAVGQPDADRHALRAAAQPAGSNL